jgi:hypothetical protein
VLVFVFHFLTSACALKPIISVGSNLPQQQQQQQQLQQLQQQQQHNEINNYEIVDPGLNSQLGQEYFFLSICPVRL